MFRISKALPSLVQNATAAEIARFVSTIKNAEQQVGEHIIKALQHADTVVQCRVERSYDEDTEQVKNIENWVVRVEGSRLAELME